MPRTSSAARTRAGITLIAPGSTSRRPTVATVAGCAVRLLAGRGLEREDDLRGGGQRVVAVGHRDLAGVPGLAVDRQLVAVGRGDPLDDAEAGAAAAQLVAGLDVDLDVRRDPPERGRAVEPGQVVEGGEELRPGRGGGDAGGVAQVLERGLGERPDHEPGADRPRAEPRRLLGGADEDAGAAAKRDRRLEREDRAERAVVAPAVRDRVDVRAGRDHRAVAGRQRPQVPVRVERDRQARLARPRRDEAHPRGLGLRVRRAVRAAAGAERDRPEIVETRGDPRGVDRVGGFARHPHGVVLS